jgi:hypothetical protein
MTKSKSDRLDGEDGRGILDRIRVYQAVNRRWAGVVTSSEFIVLSRIVDMTVGWNEDVIDTSVGQLADGRHGEGEWRLEKLPIGRSAVKTALNGLRNHRLIETRQRHHRQTGAIEGLKVTVNKDLILKGPNATATLSHVGTPKRLKTAQVDIRPGVGHNSTGGRSETNQGSVEIRPHNTGRDTSTYTGIFHEGSAIASPAGADAPASPAFDDFSSGDQLPLMPLPENETMRKSRPEKSEGITPSKGAAEKIQAEMQAIGDRNAGGRATALQKAADRVRSAVPLMPGKKARRGETVQAEDLWTIWKATYAAAAPDGREPLEWTKKERGLCLDLFRRWPHRQDGAKPNGEFDDFLAWVIAEWRSIASKHLGWMDATPKTPNINILHRWFDRFEGAFVERDRMKAASRLDIDEVTELNLRGMSYDQAITAVVQRRLRGAAKKLVASQPKAPPPARARTPLRAPRPVAPKPDMPKREDRLSTGWRKRTPEELEAELWGPKEPTAA